MHKRLANVESGEKAATRQKDCGESLLPSPPHGYFTTVDIIRAYDERSACGVPYNRNTLKILDRRVKSKRKSDVLHYPSALL